MNLFPTQHCGGEAPAPGPEFITQACRSQYCSAVENHCYETTLSRPPFVSRFRHLLMASLIWTQPSF